METEKVKEFVGKYEPQHFLLKKDEPMSVGAYATSVYYMEAKRQQAQAMIDAKEVIKKVGAEFGKITGRTYGLIETYEMEDAEEAILIIGSSAGTAKEAIQELRAQNKKVGLIKIRSFRPFPSEEIAEALYGTEQKGRLTIAGKNNQYLYKEVLKRLLPCISERRRIPLDLVRLAVQWASSPMTFKER